MKTLVQKELQLALEALRSSGWTLPEQIDVPLDKPKRAEHGDLATNVAMLLSKSADRKPIELANAIIEQLRPSFEQADRAIRSAEIAGPGFLNLRVRDFAFHEVIDRVLREGTSFGTAKEKRSGKLLLEFVSANPTGPLHMGHARGVVVGDALVRVLRAAGYDVTTEYYVNDAGQKVINLAWAVRLLVHKQGLWTEGYHGAYVQALADAIAKEHPERVQTKQATRATTAEEKLSWVEERLRKGDPLSGEEYFKLAKTELSFRPLPHDDDRALAAVCVERMMEQIRQTLHAMDVHFDRYFSEESLIADGRVPRLCAEWTANGLAEERDGALFFKAKATGEDEKDRVLRKSSGDYTYFASDVAYHADKLSRGFTHLIDVWGADHHGYVPRVRAALEALGLPKAAFEVLLMQMVALVKEGKPYRMSKSEGNFVLVDTVLEEIDAAAGKKGAGRDALRYFLLSRSADSPMELDIDLAKKQTVENPVFYAQMSHARMCQILERARTNPELAEARSKGLLFVPESFDATTAAHLNLPEEKELLAFCDAYPTVLREAAEHRAPHRVLFFVQEMAQMFASYYTRLQKVHHDAILPQKQQREVDGWMDRWDWEKTRARLLWVKTLRQVYANALGLLGVDAPVRMDRAPAEDHETEGS